MRIWFQLFVVGTLVGCAHRHVETDDGSDSDSDEAMYLTPRHIDAFGTASFDAPVDQVFKATEEAARSLSFGVSVSKTDRGLIITDKFAIDEQAFGRRGQATLLRVGRQYEIRVTSEPPGKTRVRAEPHAFENDNEVSAQPIWMLDGQWGERPRWQRLFGRIRQLL